MLQGQSNKDEMKNGVKCDDSTRLASSLEALRITTQRNSSDDYTQKDEDEPVRRQTMSSPLSASTATAVYMASSMSGNVASQVHARIQAFQNSRQSRSNSASNATLNFTPGSIPTTTNPVPSIPASCSPCSPSTPSQSSPGIVAPGNSNSSLSRSSSGGASSYTISSSCYANSNVTSPVVVPVNEEQTLASSSQNQSTSQRSTPTTPLSAGTPVGGSFSGPLFVNPTTAGAANLQSKKPSLSMRRNTPNLGTLSIDGQPNIRRNPGRLSNERGNGEGSGIFSNYRKYIDVKTGSLNFAGKASLHSKGIDFSGGSSFRISLDEFEFLGELGRGNYGTVSKVRHKPTDVIMAMKEIRLELDEAKFMQIIMELEVLHKCASPFIVDFYGAFFAEGAVYLCMEYMDGGSLDNIYEGGVAEPYLAVITKSVVKGLKQLKDEHNIIHRDVKPTNILVSTSGKIKLCDFGVSGNLVASIAKTNIGCQSYMAPERIKSAFPNDAITYTVHSDIWSLGLSILEIAKGLYPYPPETYGNIFSQLSAIVDGDPPQLPPDRFSPDARSFVDDCLNKIPRLRPSYGKLLNHPWLQRYDEEEVNLGLFIKQALNKRETNQNTSTTKRQLRPALHNGRRDI